MRSIYIRWTYCVEHEIMINNSLKSATEKIDSIDSLKMFALKIKSFKKNLQIVEDSYLNQKFSTVTIFKVHTYELWYEKLREHFKIMKSCTGSYVRKQLCNSWPQLSRGYPSHPGHIGVLRRSRPPVSCRPHPIGQPWSSARKRTNENSFFNGTSTVFCC